MSDFSPSIFDKTQDGSYKYVDAFTPMHWLHIDILEFEKRFPYATFPILNFVRDTIKFQLKTALESALKISDFKKPGDQLNEYVEIEMTSFADTRSFEDLERQILLHKKDAKHQWYSCHGYNAPHYQIDDIILQGFREAVTLFSMAKQAPVAYFPSVEACRKIEGCAEGLYC